MVSRFHRVVDCAALYLGGRCWRRRSLFLSLGLGLGLTVLEPILSPAPAQACFFWQSCAQRRGQATNTRAGGKRTGLIRGGNAATVPYVISPRHTWVSEQVPPRTIRWNAVAETDRYTVKIWQWSYERDVPHHVIWQTTVPATTGPSVAFPELPLEVGIYYSVEVVTDNGTSSHLDEGYYQTGFELLPVTDDALLRSRLSQLEATPAPNLEEAFLAQAGEYFLDEMYADALSILEELQMNPNASELVYIALGDTYSATGLNQHAIAAYGQALTRAESHTPSRSIAIATVGLADVYTQLGEFAQARQQLLQAREIYHQLGAQPEVSQLDQRIQLLSARE